MEVSAWVRGEKKIDVHVLTTFLMYLFVQLFFIIGLSSVLTTDQSKGVQQQSERGVDEDVINTFFVIAMAARAHRQIA